MILARAFRCMRVNWAIAVPAFIYLFVFPWLPELRSPNELCRLHQTRALVDHGTFEIGEVLASHGYVGDLSCVAVAREGGKVVARRPCPEVAGQARFSERHYYPSKAPLLSVAATPVYALLKLLRGGAPVGESALVFFARLFCTVLPAAMLLVLVRRFLRAHLEAELADGLTAAYALGTLAFSYAELFMSHQTAGLLLFATYYSLWRVKRDEWRARGYLVAGALAGLSVAAEYTSAMALLPLAAYALWTAPGRSAGRLRALGLGLLGVLPFAILLAAYHALAFGHPLHSGYKYLNDAAYQGWHVGGFLGIRLPDPRAFFLSFFSPLRGLFMLSPMLLVAVAGFARRFWTGERRQELMVSLSSLLLYAYFTSSFSYDSWGWTTGPRHMTSLVPFLLLPVGLALQDARTRPVLAGAGAGLVAASMLATSAMTFVNYIPDSLSEGLIQLALPLLLTGHFPHTWLSLLGVPNPWAALPAVVGVLGATGLTVWAISPRAGQLRATVACLVVLLLFGGLHAALRSRDDPARGRDASAYRFLEKRFVPRPGHASPPLWGP